MKAYIAGGVGEHGRSSYYIEGSQTAFLVDCGQALGTSQPNPRLSAEQIQRSDYLLLTHSHLDHSGAYPWLLTQGFRGQVIASAETLAQLPFAVQGPRVIEPGQLLRLNEAFSLTCGRSGHCVGSLWFEARLKGRQLLFSGDYAEDTLMYHCDKLRGRQADLAFLDSGLDEAVGSPEALRSQIYQTVQQALQAGRPVILPVPRHGRGLELICLMHALAYLQLDDHARQALEQMPSQREWFKRAMPELSGVGGSIHVICDAQLKRPGNRVLVDRLMQEEQALLLLTGYLEPGSFSEKLSRRSQARHLPYPSHASDQTATLLQGLNDFARVVRTHSERFHHERDITL